MKIFALILAGGSGTRLWPLSRKNKPKQFLYIEEHRSLIQATYQRLQDFIAPQDIYVIGSAAHAHLIKSHLPLLLDEQILLEPSTRNTAPAIAYACQYLYHKDPQSIVIVVPADHFIGDEKIFEQALKEAVIQAHQSCVVTLGMKPTRAEVGFGYIEKARMMNPSVFEVKQFIEKPSVTVAESFLKSGHYLWNAGIFVFQTQLMLQLYQTHAPEIFTAFKDLFFGIYSIEKLEQAYLRVPDISIDYAIMEKLQGIRVVETSCKWSDIGSFLSLGEIFLGPQSADNIEQANTLTVDATGNIIKSDTKKKICLLGVHDLVVINTQDALLVMNKNESQRVKNIVAQLAMDTPELL